MADSINSSIREMLIEDGRNAAGVDTLNDVCDIHTAFALFGASKVLIRLSILS